VFEDGRRRDQLIRGLNGEMRFNWRADGRAYKIVLPAWDSDSSLILARWSASRSFQL
jgi:hypothetical protein